MRRNPLLARLATACVLALCGCAGPPSQVDRDVRVVLYGNPSSLSLIGNPDGNATQVATVISDGLVAYDVQSNYVPMIARSWELTPDGKTLTFHLRENALWHDGERVTSRDVAFTVQKVRDPATQARTWVSYFSNVVSIETPDDLTVVVHYADAYADALEPWRVPLVPEHVAGSDTNFLGGAFAHHPIGCGPFQFVSYEPGQSVVVSAFDRYWGGAPGVPRLTFKIVSAERTVYESLLLGNLSLVAVTPDLWREAQSSPAAARFSKFVYYRLGAWRVDWNQSDVVPFFHDKRVRRAMLLALDRQKFGETVLAGLARPGVSSYPPESLWADPSIQALPFDPGECARLLDDAGWRVPATGKIREKDGKPFRFTLLVNAGAQEIADRVAAWMQQSLADVGVDLKIERLQWDAFRERRKKHAFEAAMGSLLLDPTPDRFDLFHSTAKDGGFNYGCFSDAEIDRLLETGRVTPDPVARRATYVNLQRRLDDLQPVSFVFQFAQPVLHDPDLEGIVASPVGLFEFAPGPRAWHWASTRTRR